MDKPLPFHRRQTDDRGTLRVVNPDAASTRQPSMDQLPSHVVADSSEMVFPVSKSRVMNNSIRRKPLASEARDELSFNLHPAPPHAPNLRSAERTPSMKASSDVPVPLAAGRKMRKHAAASYSSAVSDPGMLGISLGVYDFRSSLPAELQPKGPPLRWDPEPAPQLPPIVPGVTPNLHEDVDLAKFMTTDKSNLQPFKEKMPLATTIVRGNLSRFVAK
ncbi:uncharacterized protein N0V89_004216 [Didymosphaeria variabile]|uniref:Uncharacterized protein n=1 Tax=Didymosphaeria variabile TaxID=1932322 RepID=A0A9W9CDD8_9PLEO|nr:uncharacterized protein N0V89_004216 [Didymosphaeria variabile]KAJ4356186.1 hypothetical protein N0V89_004216 [Didymosphaeria variabile]